jgi:hypothetical protein
LLPDVGQFAFEVDCRKLQFSRANWTPRGAAAVPGRDLADRDLAPQGDEKAPRSAGLLDGKEPDMPIEK